MAYDIKMEIETIDEGNIHKNPTLSLNPENYETGYKVKGEMEECACGKLVRSYYVVIETYTSIKDESGIMLLNEYGGRTRRRVKSWEHKHYPETHCHCRCGKTWKEHLLS